MPDILVHKMEHCSLVGVVADIGAENFSGLSKDNGGFDWVWGNFLVHPRMQYYLAVDKVQREVLAYILWVEHGGFRPEAFFELEQVAVRKIYQSEGVGSKLIVQSKELISAYLKQKGRWLKTIKVTTDKENTKAQALYAKTLGAVVESDVKSPYKDGHIEVEMYARYQKTA